ncbi:MAG: DegT/DnrJ/EryC1/StrS family aminotransferase [Gammaproteobacteria bacterium]|nr:DegT/DnrJ/EryC1/StrS family aminotransferase [Gammaproteobacteria bacterium]
MTSPPGPLYVTRPMLPPLAEMLPLLEDIWSRRMLSNDGPYHQQFESALACFLGVPYVVLVSNATLGLLLALRQSRMCGKVITTPFSFVGTSHAIRWAGLEPVFVDIDSETLNIDAARLPEALDDQVAGLLPMHCFGRPCDTQGIGRFAKEHGLPIVYDAAHAFGVGDAQGSVLRHGDFSVLSFHATKVFNTFEGGAIICHDEATKRELDLLKNFGIVDETQVESVGLNAKLNEFQAALGLVQLVHVEGYIAARRQREQNYRDLLAQTPGIRLATAVPGTHNHYAFPIFVAPDHPLGRDGLYLRLREHGIFARRYFHPLISDLPMYRQLRSADPARLPVAKRVSESILCLPLFPDISESDQARVAALLGPP